MTLSSLSSRNRNLNRNRSSPPSLEKRKGRLRLREEPLPCLLVLAFFLAAALLAGSARAGEERSAETLKVTFDTRGMRSNAPARVRATFTWSGTRILEGRLELVFRYGNQSLGTYRSFDLALSGGPQTFDLLLPSLTIDGNPPQIDVQVRFLTAHQAIELEPAIWAVPHALQRACVLGVSVPPHDSDAYAKIITSLRLDALQPKREGTGSTRFSYIPLFAAPVLIPPDELPAEPLAYCSCDVLLLAGKGFALLREGQLAAITRWVKAGGSVCVVPAGSVDGRHVRFLNELAGAPTPAFTANSLGVLPTDPAGQNPAGALTFHSGLGRMAVVLKPPAERDLGSPAWRRTVAFLWKLRKGQIQTVERTGRWSDRIQFSDTLPAFDPERREQSQGTPAHPVAVCDIREVLQGLMPSQMRIIPFSVVVLILVLFVLAIGPLDYFLLGALRRRKYTWITFPLMAIAFTYFTVKLSDYYMGLRDHRRALVFVDVDRQGRPLRQHRFEMIFSGSERTARFDVKNALFQPVGRADARDWEDQRYRGYRRPSRDMDYDLGSLAQSQAFIYEGRLPSHFTAVQSLYQWTPQLNRTFSLEPPEHFPTLNWSALSVNDLLSYRTMADVREKLLRGQALPIDVVVVRGTEGACAAAPTTGFLFSSNLLVNCTRPPERGFFSLVSQVSPTGAPNFEDLAILDPTDPNQAVLVAIEHVGEDIYVYRCLYR